MEKKRNEIDELITKALNEEESEFYDQLEQPGILGEALDLYKGRNKFISIGITFVMLAFLVASVYCVIEFFAAEKVKDLIMWAGGFFFSMIGIMALKLWSWMQMDRNAVMREIKRLELQVSAIAKEIKSTVGS